MPIACNGFSSSGEIVAPRLAKAPTTHRSILRVSTSRDPRTNISISSVAEVVMTKRQHVLGIVDALHIFEDDGGRDPLETLDEPRTAPATGDDQKVEKDILTDRVIEAHDARLDEAAESC